MAMSSNISAGNNENSSSFLKRKILFSMFICFSFCLAAGVERCSWTRFNHGSLLRVTKASFSERVISISKVLCNISLALALVNSVSK